MKADIAITSEAQQDTKTRGVIKIESSIMQRAKNNDLEALEIMFRTFIPDDEKFLASQYLGVKGLWGIGNRSFGCVTNRRVASIQTGFFGEVIYQDGSMEYINSGIIYQPSKLWLYITNAFIVVLAIVLAIFLMQILGALGLLGAIIAIPLLPLVTRIYYNINKCGLVFWIREGVSVYMFTDRSRLIRANRLYRMVMNTREARIREIGHGF